MGACVCVQVNLLLYVHVSRPKLDVGYLLSLSLWFTKAGSLAESRSLPVLTSQKSQFVPGSCFCLLGLQVATGGRDRWVSVKFEGSLVHMRLHYETSS